jgi:hypothetical protein
MRVPDVSSTWRKWCVMRTGTLTAASIRAWSQLAATEPSQIARAHSGSYSFRFWVGSPPSMVAARAAIHGGSSVAAAAIMPSQSPTLHWSPRYLLHRADIGPMARRIDCPHDVSFSEWNSGGPRRGRR